jgi:imidazoleglycerol phosphate synthase glutamine amidotransferase subunit HisH
VCSSDLVQFHPEKSGASGMTMIQNFVKIAKETV